MTRDEFYAGLQVAGKTLNPTEVGVLVSLTWDAATKAERERIRLYVHDIFMKFHKPQGNSTDTAVSGVLWMLRDSLETP